jgi:hypothetical protein
MSFLRPPTSPTTKINYANLGFRHNPFPARGEVRAEVYVERDEVRPLQDALNAFLFQSGAGAFFAIQGQAGVGKSNLLLSIQTALEQHIQTLQDPHPPLIVRYLPSANVKPQQLVEELLQALGRARLLEWLKRGNLCAPARFVDMDLDRFLRNLPTDEADLEDAVDFLMLWLAGHQTYANQRKKYKILNSQRLEPFVAIPFLHGIVSRMVEAGLVEHIVLMIDEAEDVPRSPGRLTPYALALKLLLNSFNTQHLFLIVAGQDGFIRALGQHSSLESRWTVITMRPLLSPDEAVVLAKGYIEAAALTAEVPPKHPSMLEIKGLFAEILNGAGSVRRTEVTQRDLLTRLHQFVEDLARNP